MLSMHYSISLPDDYDMGAIRRRIHDKGPLLDGFDGLLFKSYRCLEADRRGHPLLAGVSEEDRCALLGHAEHSMSGHYASADIGRLLREANLVLNRQPTTPFIFVNERGGGRLWGCGRRRTRWATR